MIDRVTIRAAAESLAPRTGMSADAIEAQMLEMAANRAQMLGMNGRPRMPAPPPDRRPPVNRHERRRQAAQARRARR
jgi:hypothetical protein